MSDKKLFLIDAMALIYRAHFAFSKNPRITSTGINTSAVFGFTNSIMEVLTKEKPTHFAIAFDTAEPTFRHEAYTEYKANRQEQPEDITVAIPYVKKMMKGMRIPVLELPGYEADDIVGTVAKKAAAEGFKVYMMTMDKDYCQLVDENIFLFRPAYLGNGHEVYDIAKVLEKFQVKRVDQVRDILGLMGDSVDNIPGIPGVGEKTAQKLIAEFDSVENLIKNADQLKGKLKENVVNFAAQGLQSKELATIHCEVPIDFNCDALILQEYDKEYLGSILDELEFRTLKKRLIGGGEEETAGATSSSRAAKPAVNKSGQTSLFGGDAPVTAEAEEEVYVPVDLSSIDNTLHRYHILDTAEKRKSLLSFLSQVKEFCFDTETTSLDELDAKLVGLAISYVKGEGYYIPFPSDNEEESKKIIQEFKAVLEDEHIVKIGQNLKYDMLVLRKYDIQVKGPLFDTMLAHYLLEPDSRHGMDFLAEHYLHYAPVSIETLIGKKGAKQRNMKDVDVEKISEYAVEDADITLQLKQVFDPMLKDYPKMEEVFRRIEVPLVPVLAQMEYEGIRIDPQALYDYSGQLQAEVVEVEKEIYKDAGVEFNIASPAQLGKVLFEKLKLDDKAKKTKTGQYATGEEVLAKLAEEHKIVQNILTYRELQKLKSTYVDALPQLINPQDKRVHTSYNQAVAATGRLSSTNPNLQNIPIRTDRGREIRKAFVKKNDDYLLMSADYSQIELRIMAEFSQDESMLNAFKNGIDIHSTTASKVFKVALEEVTSDMRRKAKMVNFGIIYGISAFGLAQRLDIPRREAAEIIDAYFAEFPAIKQYMDKVVNDAREHEYVETIMGRRRYLRDINSRNMTIRGFAERNAINAPIQGSAADMIKLAMINIHDWIKKEKLQSRMILQVHDELVFDVHKSEVDIMKKGVEELMKNAIPLQVPMEVGIGLGDNWLEAH